MKKIIFLFSLVFLLNGCVESIALLGSTAGGASSGKIIQSSLQQAASYGIKKSTGKTPIGHALAYAEKNNPEKKKDTCISFIEKTKSEFCAIAKKKISLTNRAVTKKLAKTINKTTKIINPINEKITIKPKSKVVLKDSNFFDSFKQFKKSPRELAIAFQNKLKK